MFENLVGWHAGAVRFPPSDIILAQLTCPLSDIMFWLHTGITKLSFYKHWFSLVHKVSLCPVSFCWKSQRRKFLPSIMVLSRPIFSRQIKKIFVVTKPLNRNWTFGIKKYFDGVKSHLTLAITKPGNTKGGRYHCTVDLLFDWFGLVCFVNKNRNCQSS
jgi:hypothetical protein